MKDSDKKKAWAVPWIGITIIVGSLFMPYVSVLGFELTGIEITELLIEGMSSTDLSDSSDTGDDELLESSTLMVAIMMLMLSPIFFSLMGLLSLFCMLFEAHPGWVGALHVAYFGIFLICSFTSGVNLGPLGSYSVHEDLAGMGFFIGGLAGILLMVKA